MEIAKIEPQIMQMTLEKASKLDLIRHFSNLTMDKLVKKSYTSIGSLKKAYSLEQIEKVIKILLNDLSASFGGSLNTDQIEELAVELTSNILINLSLEDVYFTCRQIKISKNYHKLNVNIVLMAFEEHLSKRSEAYYEWNISKAPDAAGDVKRLAAPKNIKEIINQ